MKVKFLKQHEVDVDVERPKGAPTQLTLRDSPFDDAGRARLDLLRRGKSGPAEKVVFGPNDVGILEYAEAQRLIGAKVCDPGAPIYVRPLNDYTYAYHENFRRRMQLDEDARTVLANTATIEDANAKALQQISAQETDKKKLGEDLAKLQIELAEVAQYVQTIDRQWEAVRGELSQLYRTNLALAEELAEIQRRLAEEINRRTAPAAD
jgi:hypothetical protein